ncbi:EpsG family protein [Shewanella sp. SR44-3]|uniref:EpsG family protein n=1 Tax=Shewanella sp. SR44-3 TaxID=2760936 RepID=UPI0021757BCD|nr:EpsG family protein [Shewanella sp. SR44-3]
MFFFPLCKDGALKFFKLILVFLYSFYILFHLNSGPDHVIYQWAYEQDTFTLFEPLYLLLMYLANSFGFEYFGFLIFLKFINIILFSVFLFNSDKYTVLFFLCFYIPISFITFELNLLRQSLAIHFSLLFYTTFRKGCIKLSIFFVILAILSHISSLLLLLLYIWKVNKVFLLFFVVIVVSIALPLLTSKFFDYYHLGGFELRSGVFVIQLAVLLILPFILYKFSGDYTALFLYFFICLLSFAPVMVRLYPLALVLVMPFVYLRFKDKYLIYILLVASFSLCTLKIGLLISADQSAIKEGVYEKGYQ